MISLIQLFSVKLPGCCQYLDISLQTCSKDAGNTDCNFGGGNITTQAMCLKVLSIYNLLDWWILFSYVSFVFCLLYSRIHAIIMNA